MRCIPDYYQGVSRRQVRECFGEASVMHRRCFGDVIDIMVQLGKNRRCTLKLTGFLDALIDRCIMPANAKSRCPIYVGKYSGMLPRSIANTSPIFHRNCGERVRDAWRCLQLAITYNLEYIADVFTPTWTKPKGSIGLMGIKKYLCEAGKHFGRLRAKSVKIENNRKSADNFRKTPNALY